MAVALPTPLADADDAEVELAYQSLRTSYGLFEVSGYGTLADADCQAPRTRRQAYGYSLTDIDGEVLEAHWCLRQPVIDRYRAVLEEAARAERNMSMEMRRRGVEIRVAREAPVDWSWPRRAG